MNLQFRHDLASGYTNRAQVARVLTEDWFSREGYCLACLDRPVGRLSNNTKVADFNCRTCGELYQLKSRGAAFGSLVADGAYATFHESVLAGRAPNLLLLHYDVARMEVVDLFGIHRKMLSPLSIIRRDPLGNTARRHGWVGCNIDLRSLPSEAKIPVIRRGIETPEADVRKQWQRYSALDERAGDHGWLKDVLTCIQKVGKQEFWLNELYASEASLSELHPGNHNIRPKIRQQIQVLVREGILRRLENGYYQKV